MVNTETKFRGYFSADGIKRTQQDNSHVFSVLKLIESESLTHATSQYDYLGHTTSSNLSTVAQSLGNAEKISFDATPQNEQDGSTGLDIATPPIQMWQPDSNAVPASGSHHNDFRAESVGQDVSATPSTNSGVASLLESLFTQNSSALEIDLHINTNNLHAQEPSPSAPVSEVFVQSQNLHTTGSTNHLLFTTSTQTEDSNWSIVSGWGQAHTDKALALITGKTITSSEVNHSNPLDVMGFKAAWDSGYTGKGVVIADIDTGIDLNNQQLASNVHISNLSWNFIDQNSNIQDDNGHGTITAEELTAGPNFDDLIDGGAYDSQLMVLKALDATGKGSDASVAKAIEYAVDHGADIINLSLGQYTPDASLFSAIRYADAHGVIVVAAAGNSAAGTTNFPAAYAEFLPNVIAVGATNATQSSVAMSDFSNHAGTDKPYNFVDAIGVDILGIGLNDQEGYWSGTSMATPYISAEAAILKQANPHATASEIVQAITHTAEKIQISVAGLQIDVSASSSNQANAQSSMQSFESYHLETASSHCTQYVPSEQYY